MLARPHLAHYPKTLGVLMDDKYAVHGLDLSYDHLSPDVNKFKTKRHSALLVDAAKDRAALLGDFVTFDSGHL